MDSVIMTNIDSNNENKSIKSIFTNIKNVFNFIARIILYAILTMLVGAFLLFILYFVDMLVNINKGEAKVPLFNAYVIISPSMVPTINVNDAIVVKRVSENELAVDDIITFTSTDKKYSGLTITHRIVGTETLQNGEVVYRTKGDANNVNDSALVSLDNIHGKVILRIPLIGNIQTILSSSSGWLFFIVIPCIGILAFDIFKLIKALYLKKILREEGNSNIDKSREKLEINEKDNFINIKSDLIVPSNEEEILIEENVLKEDKTIISDSILENKNVVEETVLVDRSSEKIEEEEEEIEVL